MILATTWLVAAGALAQPLVAPLLDVSGARRPARLLDISEDWQLRFETVPPSGNSQRVSLAVEQLVCWGHYRDRSGGTRILLTDGSVLVADVVGVSADGVAVESRLWRAARLPLERIRGVIWRVPAEPLRRDRLIQRILNARGSADRILIDNGDEIAGVIKYPQQEGASLETIQIRTRSRGEPLPIPIDRIRAVVPNPAASVVATPRGKAALVGFSDGSRLVVERLVRDGKELDCRLPGGVQLRSTASGTREAWESITRIRSYSPRVVYLSDLPPLAYKHVPFLSLEWPYRLRQNVLGGWLRSGGNVYSEGVGMHSRARLVYQLDGKFARFEAELAVDDVAEARGSVVFKIFLQEYQPGRPAAQPGAWREAYLSPTVRGGRTPIPVSVDVANGYRLALIVDYADRGDERDYANWLGARLIRKRE